MKPSVSYRDVGWVATWLLGMRWAGTWEKTISKSCFQLHSHLHLTGAWCLKFPSSLRFYGVCFSLAGLLWHWNFSFLHLATSGSLPPNCFTSSKYVISLGHCLFSWLCVSIHVCTGVYVCGDGDDHNIVQLALAASSGDTSFFPTGWYSISFQLHILNGCHALVRVCLYL